MVQTDKRVHRESEEKQHGYRVYVKHSNKNRSLTDCMKEAIKSTLDKSIV